MTLAEMAAHVCGKVNQQETGDLTACKGFLAVKHETIWNEALWKDSLVEYTQTLSPTGYTVASTWLPTLGILLLPSIIQRVVAVRNDSRRLNVQRPEFYYRQDFDSFGATGTPADFVLLPPCVWQTQSAQVWRLAIGDAGDAGTAAQADLLDADGVGVTRYALTLANTPLSLTSTTRIDTLSKTADSNGAAYLRSSATATLVNNSADTRDFYISEAIPPVAASITTLAPGASAQINPDAYIWSVLTGAGLGDYSDYSAIPLAGRFIGTVTYAGVGSWAFDQSTGLVLTIPAADSAAPRRQRIRLVSIPTASQVIRVLGKRVCPEFTNDNDEPGMNCMEDALLTFAQADMLERERQYGKAQAKKAEAVALIDQLKRIETVQQAHNVRFIPEDGYGNTDMWNQGAQPLTF